MKTTFLGLFVALLLGLPSGDVNAFSNIPGYTLTYSVQYKGTGLGKLVISVEEQSDEVVVHGETFPNALASLFGDGKIVETIEYQKVPEGLRLAKVTERKGHDGSQVDVAEVSALGDRIEFKNGKSYRIKPTDQLDSYTFPFLSLLGLHDSKAGEKESVVSAKRMSKYVYQNPSKERVSVPAGEFAALKTTKSRADSKKSISVWITESLPRYPLKIEVLRNGKRDATISLLSKES